jgi:dolichol kinase
MGKSKEKISERQLSVLCFVALFSPLIRNVPRAAVAEGGKAGWLSPLAALIPALLVVWVLRKGLKLVPEGGMGQILRLGYGEVLGRFLCFCEAVWLFGELSLCIRLFGERFVGSAYRDTSIFLFLFTLAALTLWQSRKPLAAVVRLAQVGFFPLTITVAAILILGIGQGKAENWLPVAWSDGGAVLRGIPSVLSIFGLVLVGFFLGGEIRREGRGKSLQWTAAYFIVATIMGVVVLAAFGPGLVERLQLPFFSLAKEIRVGSVLERMEAFVMAVWVVSDVLLAVLLQRALCRVLADGVNTKEDSVFALPVVVGAVLGSVLCGSREETVLQVAEEWFSVVRGWMIYAVPLVGCLLALGKERRKCKKMKKGG